MLTIADWSPLWVSLRATLPATAIAALGAIVMARWMLDYRSPGRAWVNTVLMLPLVLPPIAVGLGLLMLLGRSGPVGRGLATWGISIVFSPVAVMITAAIAAFNPPTFPPCAYCCRP